MPFPAPNEQRLIVELLEDHLARLREVEAQITALRFDVGRGRNHAAALRRALAAAFSGRLTGASADPSEVEGIIDA